MQYSIRSNAFTSERPKAPRVETPLRTGRLPGYCEARPDGPTHALEGARCRQYRSPGCRVLHRELDHVAAELSDVSAGRAIRCPIGSGNGRQVSAKIRRAEVCEGLIIPRAITAWPLGNPLGESTLLQAIVGNLFAEGRPSGPVLDPHGPIRAIGADGVLHVRRNLIAGLYRDALDDHTGDTRRQIKLIPGVILRRRTTRSATIRSGSNLLYSTVRISIYAHPKHRVIVRGFGAVEFRDLPRACSQAELRALHNVAGPIGGGRPGENPV